MAYQSFTPASWEHFKDVLPQKIWKHVDLTTNTTAGLLALISGYDTVSVYIGTAFEFKSGTTNADKWLFAAAQTVNFWRTGTNSFRAIARVTFSKANSDAYITKDMLITTSAAAINCAELYGDGMKYATLSNVISALSTNGIRGAAGDVNVFRVTQESTITYNNETYTVPAYTYITAACCPLTTGSSPEGTWIASPIYATDSEGTPCILFLDANGVRQVMKGASEHYKKIYIGTQADWNALTLAEKKQYDLADFTDDTASGVPIISDTVTDGDMNAVTSNAVAAAIATATTAIATTIGEFTDLGSFGTLNAAGTKIYTDAVANISAGNSGLYCVNVTGIGYLFGRVFRVSTEAHGIFTVQENGNSIKRIYSWSRWSNMYSAQYWGYAELTDA